jgi:hypothetical protein
MGGFGLGFGVSHEGFTVWVLLLGFGSNHIKKCVGLHFNGFGGFGNDAIPSLEVGVELFYELFFYFLIFLVFELIFEFFMVLEVEEGLFTIVIEQVPIEVKGIVYFF